MKKYDFLLLLALCFPSAAAVHQLSADTLSAWITSGPPISFILVDLRDTSELDSVIGTASCRPYHMSFNQGVFAQSFPLIPKSGNVIVYCKGGSRSGMASTKLDSAGYSNVYNLVGGISGYKGPKSPPSIVLPISDLPKNSMTQASFVLFSHQSIIHETAQSPSAVLLYEMKRSRIIISRMDAGTGMSRLYNVEGRILRISQ